MKIQHSIMRYFAIFAITMIASITACSYAMDMVERSITKRASFSINAVYDGTSIHISWNETGGSNFAGYEIYITERPDDEYSGYRVVAARYDLRPDSYFFTVPGLGNIGTQSYVYNATNYKNTFGTGRYFVRVGIIAWDQPEDKRNADNGYIGSWETEINYENHTDIEEISGSAIVDIL